MGRAFAGRHITELGAAWLGDEPGRPRWCASLMLEVPGNVLGLLQSWDYFICPGGQSFEQFFNSPRGPDS